MTVVARDAALKEASIPTLLMCLAQITRDPRWLDEPFRPKRDISIFAEPSGGLSELAQQSVRGAIAGVLDELAAGTRSLPEPLSEAELARMMSVCVGENVPPEYSPMAMEEMGFADRAVSWREVPSPQRLSRFKVLVVGAGFTGLCAAFRLRQMGIAFDIVERNSDLGGTWFENDYPEAGVDTPNHFYSYSFAPNRQWSSNYSKRDEVLAYQRQVAETCGVAGLIQFGQQVQSMRWQEDRGSWEVCLRSAAGAEVTRHYQTVITAAGHLNQPKITAIPGSERFRGPIWHSARWRKDLSLVGKRVAVIGTGASAMQFLRSVAAEAAHVTIFQRSPQWARPPQDYHGSVSTGERWLLDHVPYYYAWYRFGLMWRFGDGLLPTIRRDPAWPHPERAVNHRNDRQREQLTEYLLEQLDGRPDLIAKCLPDYPPYGKRILIDNGWYQTLKRPNVDLVTEGVDHIDEGGLVTPSGQRVEADVIVLATGFEASRMLAGIEIRGRSGTELQSVWGDDDARAYLGMTVPDYPNLFITYGPNTGLAHGGSIILVTECQVRYALLAVREMLERDWVSLEVRAQVYDQYVERVDAEHARLIWTHPGMDTWYRNKAGRVFSPMPFRIVDYWTMTREPNFDDYRIVGASRG